MSPLSKSVGPVEIDFIGPSKNSGTSLCIHRNKPLYFLATSILVSTKINRFQGFSAMNPYMIDSTTLSRRKIATGLQP